MKRRVTASLTLVLIGSASLHGCGDDPPPQARDLYRSRADCQLDWGDDPKKCEPVSSGPHSGFFYGPMYMPGAAGLSSSTPRSGSRAMSTHVSRGGFGSSSSMHSSGG